MTAVLTASGVIKDFDGFRAVDGVDLSLTEGSIHSLIGPNGAGKSTLFYLITGHLDPTHGEIHLMAKKISRLAPNRIVRLGLTCTFQTTSVFPQLSVRESVECALLAASRRSVLPIARFGAPIGRRARELLSQTGLDEYADLQASALSHGDQRTLEITLALATEPRVLLLDEPTAGMSIAETTRITQLIVDLARQHGLTILLVEHDMSVVFGISDHVTVMHHGLVLAEGSPADIKADPQVNAVYLGAS